ncbi:MAG: DUF748 domain-containing protein [Polymorphobacter sp.]|uniref:DUF748 domain-containing protein n=1 Tax=Polymorphobacter sp. TaxID=1909290 RepID=UPI003A837B1A
MRAVAKPAAIAASVLALLLIAATLSVPRLVRSSAQSWVAENLPGKALVLADARFNPLTLTLTLGGLAIGDTAAPPMVAVKQLVLNASLASLFTLTPRFDAITVTEPSIDAVLRPDGSLNLVELVPPDDGEPLPEVHITSLSLTDGALTLTDRRTDTPHSARLTPITFTLNEFSTAPGDEGGFRLAGQSEAGEAFTFEGALAAAPLASSGALTLTNIRLETLARFAADALPLSAASGTLSLAGDYSVAVPTDAEKPLELGAHLASLALADVTLATAQGDSLALKSARLGDTRFSSAEDSLTIGPLSLEALDASLASGEHLTLETLALASNRLTPSTNALEAGALTLTALQVSGGKNPPLRLASLALAPSRIDTPTQSVSLGALSLAGLSASPRLSRTYAPSLPGLWPRRSTAETPDTPAWSVSLESLSATETDLTLLHPAARTRITGALSLGALTSSLDTETPIEADLLIGRAPLKLSGTVTPATSSAALSLTLANLDLAALAPMAPPMPVVLKQGRLSLDGQLALRNTVPRFTGGLTLASLDIKQPLPPQMKAPNRPPTSPASNSSAPRASPPPPAASTSSA